MGGTTCHEHMAGAQRGKTVGVTSKHFARLSHPDSKEKMRFIYRVAVKVL